MLYELRIYYMHPGKTEAIHRRFAEHTLGLFRKHGIQVTDFWEDAEGGPKLFYIVEYPDRETRDQKWGAFQADPVWRETKRQSEAEGPIVERIEEHFMNRVPYWPQN